MPAAYNATSHPREVRMMTTSQTPRSPRLKRQSLAKTLVLELSRQIAEQLIRCGDKLPTETQMMRVHNVSRTVVREAISRLQASGAVETRHGIGTFVLANPKTHGLYIDPQTIATLREVIDVLEFRTCIEVEAAGLAAVRCTHEDILLMRKALEDFSLPGHAGDAGDAGDAVMADFRFHYQIALATGNTYFADIISHLGPGILPRNRLDSARLSQTDPRPYQARLIREHQDIYLAIVRGDPDAARAAMRLHLVNSRERLRSAHDLAQDVASD